MDFAERTFDSAGQKGTDIQPNVKIFDTSCAESVQTSQALIEDKSLPSPFNKEKVEQKFQKIIAEEITIEQSRAAMSPPILPYQAKSVVAKVKKRYSIDCDASHSVVSNGSQQSLQFDGIGSTLPNSNQFTRVHSKFNNHNKVGISLLSPSQLYMQRLINAQTVDPTKQVSADLRSSYGTKPGRRQIQSKEVTMRMKRLQHPYGQLEDSTEHTFGTRDHRMRSNNTTYPGSPHSQYEIKTPTVKGCKADL